MDTVQQIVSLFLLLIISPILLQLRVDAQTLDQYESQANFSKYHVPSLEVGNIAQSITVNERTGKVYVANSGSNSISVIDTNNMKMKNIRVGTFPNDILIDSSTGYVFVANGNEKTISVIDGQNDSKIEDILVGGSMGALLDSFVPPRLFVPNRDSGSIFVFDIYNFSKIGEIPVGKGEISMDIDDIDNRIYVANSNSSNVLVFDELNFSKIGEIPVGIDSDRVNGEIIDAFNTLFVDDGDHKIYVSHDVYTIDSGTYSFSIIDGKNNTKIREIQGHLLEPDYTNEELKYKNIKYLYVTNIMNSTTSVLDPSNFRKINEIKESPLFYVEDNRKGLIYLPNDEERKVMIYNKTLTKLGEIYTGFYSLSWDLNRKTGVMYIIDSDTNRISAIYNSTILAGVAIDVNPSDSGSIICNGINFPTNKYLFVGSGTECVPRPNKDFQFSSWSENQGNSVRTLNVSTAYDSPFRPILNAIGLDQYNDTSRTFKVSKYGNFTANFIAIPPPISNEYLIPLYGIIVSTVVGWSIPSIVGWTKSKMDVRKLNHIHRQISNLYDDGKLDEGDFIDMNNLFRNISDEYSKGRINNEHYMNLRGEISILYAELFNKRIDSWSRSAGKDGNSKTLLNKVRDEITDAYSKGKISELHYNILKEKISRISQDGL